jgi:hypothetical protein
VSSEERKNRKARRTRGVTPAAPAIEVFPFLQFNSGRSAADNEVNHA